MPRREASTDARLGALFGTLVTLVPVGLLAVTAVGWRGQIDVGRLLLALAIPPATAWLLGRWVLVPAFFFVYGCLAGLLFVPTLHYVHTRTITVRPAVEDVVYVLGCIGGIFVVGMTCRRLSAAGSTGSGHRRRRGRPRNRSCAQCGYNLTGNVSSLCPECGTPRPKNPLAARRR